MTDITLISTWQLAMPTITGRAAARPLGYLARRLDYDTPFDGPRRDPFRESRLSHVSPERRPVVTLSVKTKALFTSAMTLPESKQSFRKLLCARAAHCDICSSHPYMERGLVRGSAGN